MGSLAKETLGDIEMYLHLLLLISPVLQAARLPSSPPIDIGEGIFKQLDTLPGFNDFYRRKEPLFTKEANDIYRNISKRLSNTLNVTTDLGIYKIASDNDNDNDDDNVDIEEEIIKQLEALPAFTEEAKVLLKNITKEIYKILSEKLAEAENDVIKLHVELTSLETKDLKFKKDYFEEFNEAKRHLRESRQQLRKLADRTVKEVGILKGFLNKLDESNDTDLLKISIDNMENLMDETIDTLKEAREEYNSALCVFQTLNTSIKSYKLQLKRKVDNMTATLIEVEGIRKSYESIKPTTATTIGLIFADIFGCLGICSTLNAIKIDYINTRIEIAELSIDFTPSDFENMQRILDGLTKSGEDFNSSIRGAVAILNDEVDLLLRWKNNAEIVKKNIDRYSLKYLRKMKIIRSAFVKGLDDLENTAEEFLARPIEIL